MLDTHPAPDLAARPPAAATALVPAPTPVRPKSSALLAAAGALLPALEAGRALDAPVLRQAMTGAFGASDTRGAWVWKDAYEAAEAAKVLFLQRYGRAMRRETGPEPHGPAAMLRMLETLAALEPSHTRRSEEKLLLQQFSTPLPLAYAALQAGMIRPGDVVLEPPAGTGMLAVMAQCALGSSAAGALHLNEPAATRAGLLSGLFPGCAVTRHNAEANRHVPAGPGGALRLAKQAPPPENLIGVEIVALGHHRHRDPRLMGLRHDLTLLRLAPPSATATNRSAAISARLLLGNRHQPSVHLNRSGHLRSTHFPIAHTAKAHATGTGGLRRRVTLDARPVHFSLISIRRHSLGRHAGATKFPAPFSPTAAADGPIFDFP